MRIAPAPETGTEKHKRRHLFFVMHESRDAVMIAPGGFN